MIHSTWTTSREMLVIVNRSVRYVEGRPDSHFGVADTAIRCKTCRRPVHAPSTGAKVLARTHGGLDLMCGPCLKAAVGSGKWKSTLWWDDRSKELERHRRQDEKTEF